MLKHAWSFGYTLIWIKQDLHRFQSTESTTPRTEKPEHQEIYPMAFFVSPRI